MTSRKDFIKRACISGACLCGFGSVAFSSGNVKEEHKQTQTENKDLLQEWISILLANAGSGFSEEDKRKLLKKTALAHYHNLKMDEMLAEYKGDLEKFIGFIEKQWGWKVSYDKATNTLIADENKDFCVCPVSLYKKGDDTAAMCYCSEGFAEKMFSIVAGVTTSATVISSIRRGDQRCKYKIIFA
jgi:hypothetical protein